MGPTVNFPCSHGTIHQLSVRLRYHPSTFRTSGDVPSTSINFPYICWTFRKLPLSFYASAGTSVKYPCGSRISLIIRQLYVRQRDIPSAFHSSAEPSINFHQHFVCSWKHFLRKLDLPLNFRQLSVWPRVLPSSFCASAGPSVIFRKHSVQSRASVNLSQLFMRPQDLPSTFRAAAGPFANFLCVWGNIHQLSVRLGTFHQLLSTFRASARSFVNNMCCHRTFRQHQSTFRASAGLTVHLCQLFMRPVDLLSAFLAFEGPVYFVQLPSSTR